MNVRPTLTSHPHRFNVAAMPVIQRMLMRRASNRQDLQLEGLLAELLSGLTGRVLELGCGTGFLFRHYPTTLDYLVAIEPNDLYRRRATQLTSQLPFPTDVINYDKVGEIPLVNDSVDYVVCLNTLCSVADPHSILREARRVLRPGGELRVFEHVRADNLAGRCLQHVLDRLIWTSLIGCSTTRDTEREVMRAGLRWRSIRHLWYANSVALWPAGPAIIGSAEP